MEWRAWSGFPSFSTSWVVRHHFSHIASFRLLTRTVDAVECTCHCEMRSTERLVQGLPSQSTGPGAAPWSWFGSAVLPCGESWTSGAHFTLHCHLSACMSWGRFSVPCFWCLCIACHKAADVGGRLGFYHCVSGFRTVSSRGV